MAEPITWQNIPGLTDEERGLYASAFSIDDLSTQSLSGIVVNGKKLPAIKNGVVQR